MPGFDRPCAIQVGDLAFGVGERASPPWPTLHVPRIPQGIAEGACAGLAALPKPSWVTAPSSL